MACVCMWLSLMPKHLMYGLCFPYCLQLDWMFIETEGVIRALKQNVSEKRSLRKRCSHSHTKKNPKLFQTPINFRVLFEINMQVENMEFLIVMCVMYEPDAFEIDVFTVHMSHTHIASISISFADSILVGVISKWLDTFWHILSFLLQQHFSIRTKNSQQRAKGV